ncbi:hypothetical protein T552_01732 [Pneumocystis carinii B80]|uniref:RING-type E3 ubiquitin transferase n=1 Tax=Pneumocystis carinii (strain B80) TaxID=1408658 RepID=A0A0W4ZJD0_PNEC8|nr:hypothetical protein T552_01732 [Pneumocystis carinii B80]KTW28472.1 hypothetical protein T552_01732 [Pneumocystis carinii B80]
MKLVIYGASSTIATGIVILSAFLNRSNFYASCIYMTESSACLIVLMNMGLFLATIIGKVIQRIFFGPLRAIEIEHLYERAWYSITETCLAMTIFRNSFDTRSIIVFIVLIFLKTFHWLCFDRLEFARQSETILLRQHARIVISIVFLLIIDIIMTNFSINTILHEKPSMMLMFAFEFAILTSTIIGAGIKYIFNLIDSYQDTWENKALYVLYLELFMELFKLIAYSIFFILALTFYGLPLHIIRDIYMAFKSFLAKCRDLIRYKRVTNNMNQRFIDATYEEIATTEDKTCIICREEMVHSSMKKLDKNDKSQSRINSTPKKLPCNHILHFNCLKNWLERQQSCPTCRQSVLEDQSREIFNINRTQIFHFLRNLGRRNAEAPNRNQEIRQNRNPVPQNPPNYQNPQNTPIFPNNYRFYSDWTVIPLINQNIHSIHNINNNNNSDTSLSDNTESTNQNKQTDSNSSFEVNKGKNSIKAFCLNNVDSNFQSAFPERLDIINFKAQAPSNTICTTDLNLTKVNSTLFDADSIKKIEESNKLLLQAQEKISQSLQILKTQELQKNVESKTPSNTDETDKNLNKDTSLIENS